MMRPSVRLYGIYTLCLLWGGISNLAAQPAAPEALVAVGYDSHIELTWARNAEPNITGYQIYRSDDGVTFTRVGSAGSNRDYYIDFLAARPRTAWYKLKAEDSQGGVSDFSAVAQAATYAMTDDQLMTMVQRYTFRYFWEFAHPVSGMARERNTTSIVTTGGTGFGILSILAAVERGFISYDDGRERLQKMATFLEGADRFHGAFPHWMNGNTGDVIPFSTQDNGGDLVETAFLIQGLLTARQYFEEATPEDSTLRATITRIWEEVDWNWYRKTVGNVLYWHWSPTYGWAMNFPLRGFNETHIVYLLAMASPTHPIPPSLYQTGWAGGSYLNGGTYYGFPLEVGPFRGGPLFFAHYSYLAFDPRGKKDAYTNYFNRNTYHSLINWSYCVDNPENHAGYSSISWGLTASDNPWGYLAHEPTASQDNGTITPTAALSSMPYTPMQSMDALRHFYRDRGSRLWGYYGFYDAFNDDANWYASSYLAIDQGPIIAMIENHRSGLLWDYFMRDSAIVAAVAAAGFVPDTTRVTTSLESLDQQELHVYADAAERSLIVEGMGTQPMQVSISVMSLHGQVLMQFPAERLSAGPWAVRLPADRLSAGMYLIVLKSPEGLVRSQKVLVAW
ncbi:MAG: glucoamylase family protein [Bacteroidia bacterium]|nr:glucoamylase family protein [Bacteroidia bacterium]